MRQILREFGLGEHESPRTVLDILLGAIGGFAGLVLIAFLFEKSPSPELRRNAVISFAILPIVIALAKNRLAVIAAIVVIIGFRGLVAALLYGYWPAIGFTAFAVAVFYLSKWWYESKNR